MVIPSPSRLFTRPLLLLVVLLSAVHVCAKPGQWAAEIDKLTANDATNPPPHGAVVFVGSSSIRFWTTLAEDFPGIVTINRGFGGSELADTVFYADRIVIPYAPRLVVVYAGDNDLWAGKRSQDVLDDFRAFRAKVRAALPETKIIYLSIKESPSRASIRDRVIATNQIIAAACKTDPRCVFVDVDTPMLNAEGQMRPELFRDDQLHLRPEGYAIWTKVLAPYLKE